tara:strand:- start:605 stop:832 length:228 start_codon:yes stop_codon:yes gene_type:complete
MAGGLKNEPTTDGKIKLTRIRFETDIKKRDRPPWYFVPEKYEKDTGLNYKNYHLPHGAGVCKVTWPEGKLNFEWS